MSAPLESNRERGQMLALFAICLVAIIAMTGLVIDGGMTLTQRREEQNTADAAAMAGAYAYATTSNASAAISEARDTAAANGYTHGQDGAVVTVTVSQSGGLATVTANVTKPHRNYFSGIVGFGSWDVSVTASAVAGSPNAATGAMPLLFNVKTFTSGYGQGNEVAFDEPGTGDQDVPQTANQFNWTVYCTANGNHSCNANTDVVDDLINRGGKTTEVKLTDDIGPLNAGAHAALFSSLAAYVGQEFPVAIVNDAGELQGWAVFRITGSVGGDTKQIRGHFVSPVNKETLKIVSDGGAGTNFGDTDVRLTN